MTVGNSSNATGENERDVVSSNTYSCVPQYHSEHCICNEKMRSTNDQKQFKRILFVDPICIYIAYFCDVNSPSFVLRHGLTTIANNASGILKANWRAAYFRHMIV